MMMINSEMEGI